MLTDSELTQARALSSPEIPDDDETAKRPTRQLVRKLLAHIDAQEKACVTFDKCHRSACQEIITLSCEKDKLKDALHAALDAKEKAEQRCGDMVELLGHEVIAKEKAEAERYEQWIDSEGSVWIRPTPQAYAQTCKVLNEWKNKVSELQAIVDRLPKTADGKPISHGMVLWRMRRGVAVSGQFVMRGDGENYYAKAYECYSTREAALSAAASSGAKEKQS